MFERRHAVLALHSLLLAASMYAAPPAHAQAERSGEPRIEGIAPDIVVSGGGGIGVGNTLDTNVFARLRLGVLYAFEPLILNLGVTGELGALAERGAGVELELNHFGGPFVQVGASRVLREHFMGHLAVGFAVFGVEWQHRFADPAENAVLFLLRAPIGIWWLTRGRTR